MRGNNHIAFFAETNFRNIRRKFGIKLHDRRRHIYIVGKTGTGKSTLLQNLIVSDIRTGLGLAVIDPHGDLVESILDYVPDSRIKDVIYFNPADVEYPIAFNVLETVSAVHRPLVASGLISVFKKIWSEFWGPRLEYVLRNALLALLERAETTLLDLPRLLTDEDFRMGLVAEITDPVVRTFWEKEYERYPKVFRTEAISPVQNKIG
ncbi:MAG: type IV secretion system DNA-binding domain-containing protein, partial [Nitrospira sp.]|nr:type IV secretion system DNA-binding domain-containing protein [Nitrospira sp.]